MYRVTNISGGQLVCSLADKKTTLRLNNKASENVADDLMTRYLFSVEKKGLIRLEHVSTDSKTPKVNATPANEKEG